MRADFGIYRSPLVGSAGRARRDHSWHFDTEIGVVASHTVIKRFGSAADEPGQRRRGLPILASPASEWPVTPQRADRVTVGSLLREGDAAAAARAAGSLAEFVARQQGQVVTLGRRERGGSTKRRAADLRLWLDDGHWLAWTICGELVSVEEIEPGSTRGSPEVRRLRPDELPDVFAANRLIPTVIALYRGDSLDRGAVWRYIAHHDLKRAIGAALARAQAEEQRLAAAAMRVVEAPRAQQQRERSPRATKTRHHPLGNFIVYRRPRPDEGLPDYAAVLELPPVPDAFPDRRSASRFVAKMPRLGLDPVGLIVARVIGSVEVKPVWWAGIQVPREPDEIVDLIRREPRVVLPELNAAWLPRYEQDEDGLWQLEKVLKRGTVRHRHKQILLQRVTGEGRRFAAAIQENDIRRCVGAEETCVDVPLHLVHQAERRLPEAWLGQLGMERESLGPDWQRLASVGPVADEGHWLRAPCEHGRAHVDGQRRRIVELRISDLAGLLEVAGMRPRFLLVKESTREAPRWALSVNATWQ